jgi:hypothetical protein
MKLCNIVHFCNYVHDKFHFTNKNENEYETYRQRHYLFQASKQKIDHLVVESRRQPNLGHLDLGLGHLVGSIGLSLRVTWGWCRGASSSMVVAPAATPFPHMSRLGKIRSRRAWICRVHASPFNGLGVLDHREASLLQVVLPW